MQRPPVASRPSLSFPVLAAALIVLIVLALGGCYTNDSVEPRRDPPVAPVLAVEPQFSPGFQNIVSWSLAEEERLDPGAVLRVPEPRIGSTHHYRVQGRNPKGTVTEWSANQTSTQDAVPPTFATLTELKDEQESTS